MKFFDSTVLQTYVLKCYKAPKFDFGIHMAQIVFSTYYEHLS
jgi:hypothetical protein